MEQLAFDRLLGDYNPRQEQQFLMPYRAACRYFPKNEKSLTSPYPFGGTANNNSLEDAALEMGWNVKMINDAKYSYGIRTIEFKKR